MGRTACTEPQWLYKGALYLYQVWTPSSWYVHGFLRLLFFPLCCHRLCSPLIFFVKSQSLKSLVSTVVHDHIMPSPYKPSVSVDTRSLNLQDVSGMRSLHLILSFLLYCLACRYSPVEMWWHTVTHRRGSEEKTGEWNGSQYSSHYQGTWCIRHYYRWCAHLGCQ